MEIIIKRIAKKKDYTIGKLSIDGKWVCDTLEPHCIDWATEKKVAGKTAIPKGRYRVVMRQSHRFGKDMPNLLKVPHFTGVMIHQGNVPKNTKGCIIVGYNTIRGIVLKSRQAMEQIESAIKGARKKKEEMWCAIY